jgi:hypothetical protein
LQRRTAALIISAPPHILIRAVTVVLHSVLAHPAIHAASQTTVLTILSGHGLLQRTNKAAELSGIVANERLGS